MVYTIRFVEKTLISSIYKIISDNNLTKYVPHPQLWVFTPSTSIKRNACQIFFRKPRSRQISLKSVIRARIPFKNKVYDRDTM